MADWVKVKEEKRYDDRQGQDLKTDYYELLSITLPAPKTPAPQSFDRIFEYREGLATYQESYYVGNSDPNDGYIYNTTLSQEPLETHPRWQKGSKKINDDEWQKYRAWLNDPATAGWTPEQGTANFKDFWKYKERGVETWLDYSVEVQVTTIENQKPNINKVGRIDALPSGTAFTLREGRNWMLVGIDADRLGGGSQPKWRVVKTYRSSGAGGWDNDIYSRT